MTGRSAKVAAWVLVCAGVVASAAITASRFFPRATPELVRRLANPFPHKTGQADLEAVLERVAKRLDPAMRTKLAEAIASESERFGYDPFFILGLVSVESGFRPHVSSERGAYGLMQLKPSTFAFIAGREPDIGDGAAVSEDPVIDVRLAVRYFRWLENRFHRREEALMAYNAGPARMRHYKRTRIPASLREYPRRIMSEYRRFQKLTAGPDPRAVVLARAN